MMSFNILKLWNSSLGRHENAQSSYNMIKTIEAEHARIHQGTGYGFSEKLTILSGSAHNYIIDTNSTDIHFRSYGFNSTLGPCDIYLYDSPFFDAASAGTQKYGVNRNRSFSDSSGMILNSQPFVDVNSLGKVLQYGLIEATGAIKESSGGNSLSPQGEYDLAVNKKYLLRIINNNVSTATVGFDTFWYQES